MLQLRCSGPRESLIDFLTRALHTQQDGEKILPQHQICILPCSQVHWCLGITESPPKTDPGPAHPSSSTPYGVQHCLVKQQKEIAQDKRSWQQGDRVQGLEMQTNL